ncbi:hypothetical protein [Pseudonocardia parietis]|uniref:Uncharacterized protein n=1 Tax=Pseudonocardia parietis TaxID=570936 RepID=A0ABS4VNN9_9PSEU|nr:hypothetical protein [Pseudonocardia parietis]MBP2365542.1 hypothetical protein [Pseudonocardia parietis]
MTTSVSGRAVPAHRGGPPGPGVEPAVLTAHDGPTAEPATLAELDTLAALGDRCS